LHSITVLKTTTTGQYNSEMDYNTEFLNVAELGDDEDIIEESVSESANENVEEDVPEMARETFCDDPINNNVNSTLDASIDSTVSSSVNADKEPPILVNTSANTVCTKTGWKIAKIMSKPKVLYFFR
jgi:hypothetical protein